MGHAALSLSLVFHPEKSSADQLSEIDATVEAVIIVPIIVIYAKYYGRRVAWFLTGTFYLTMVLAGYSWNSCSPRCISCRPARDAPRSVRTASAGTTPPG